ncbi:ATP-binding protein [Streptomyces sp. NPDC048331]|uniref:ATP-binding protein n=1 Tax=Streptomyces sp. NPDC048331 TaxID=3365534 RepID=UPI00371117BF
MNQKKVLQLPTPVGQFDVLLSPTPRGARLARLLAVDWLRTRDLPYRVTQAAEQVVAELAANAASHGRVAGRDFRLALLADINILRIEVTDTRGGDLPVSRASAPDAESGRGLLLVEALADRWGVGIGPVPRKTVWAELDLPCPWPADIDLPPETARWDTGGRDDPKTQDTREKRPHQTPPFPPMAHAHSLG